MILYFGLDYDDQVYPQLLDKGEKAESGRLYLGPKQLLRFLEGQFGINANGAENDYLRIEHYRQQIKNHLNFHPNAFYAASFEADQMGTAYALLEWRDELKLAGWDFSEREGLPARLQSLCQLEGLLTGTSEPFMQGYADRYLIVTELLKEAPVAVDAIWLNEPVDLLPSYLIRVLELIAPNEVKQMVFQESEPDGTSDLSVFQSLLNGEADFTREKTKVDGSLLVFKFKRETEAAAWLASLFRLNPQFRPVCLIPEKNRVLDNAMVHEGLPSMGILSESVVRPTLQVLKLVSAFLWNPVDPFKIMEFVSLSMAPLHPELAALIAEEVSNTPGLNSARWRAMVANFFKYLEKQAAFNPSIDVRRVRKEYRLWFESPRFDIAGTVPVEIVIEKFKYLAEWGLTAFKEGNKKQRSLLVLSEQARKIKEILQALPDAESSLTNLQVERIVRTVYEPSPVSFQERQFGHFPFIHFPGALTDKIDRLVWWNFIDPGADTDFNKWYPGEILFFQKAGIKPVYQEMLHKQKLWQMVQPVLCTNKQLILILPDWSDGSEVQPHPLYSDLVAAFDDPHALVFEPQKTSTGFPDRWFKLPTQVELKPNPFGQPKAYIEINNRFSLIENKRESYSSLNSLFYYPYQWVFRHQARLKKSSILSIVKEPTLMGNLAHRLFEFLFKEDIHNWTKTQTESWISGRMKRLFEEEGAVLLLYGKEPERVNFENKLKYAAWTLVRMIQNNRWEKVETEIILEGKFMDIPLKGVADMVLTRGSEKAIVDLKWRGGAYRERLMRNKEDLQLVLYSRLLSPEGAWAHTSYFILESGKMIARNNLAFKEAVTVAPGEDYNMINQEIYDKMVNTYLWRKSQLEKGKVEVRTEQTATFLDEEFSENADFEKLLEMKDSDAPFDDFKTLISLLK